MSTSFSPTPHALRVEIKPSRYFCVALIIALAFACAAIAYAQIDARLRGCLYIFVLIYAGHCWRVQRRQRGALQWRSTWYWRGADGSERALRLRELTLWPQLIVLNFRDIERGRRITLTLCADSFVDADDARRLRVHLNHYPVFASADAID